MNNVICIAKFAAQTNKLPELESRLQELVRLSRLEAGCIDYDLCYAQDGVFDFFIVERYKTKDDFEIHSNKDYLVRLLGDLEALTTKASIQIGENVQQLL